MMLHQSFVTSTKIILIHIFFFIIQIMSMGQMVAQGIAVNGRISCTRYPVQNALITFIDNANSARTFSALTDASGAYQITITSASSGSPSNTIPKNFKVAQNYPNPFSSSTTIPYELNKESHIQVTIYDVLGRAVRTVDAGQKAVGLHSVLWDGRTGGGERVANGIYFYRLSANGESQVKKMILNGGGDGVTSLPLAMSPNGSVAAANLIGNTLGATYTVRIENTGTTAPVIVLKEIQNVVADNNTTMNFTVDGVPMAVIDMDSVHQYIRGFGAANIVLWRPDMTDSEIETAFGTGDGQLGFSILRIMVEQDTSRWILSVHAAKKAQAMGAIIIASPWYAPDALTEIFGTYVRVRNDKYADYASHLNSFNSFMARNGVTIYGISVQNEPDMLKNWTGWTANDMLRFVRDYAPAIVGTRLMAPESFHFDHSYSDPILNDSLACAHTDIICGHLYGGGLGSYPLAGQQGKEVWMTEYLLGDNNSGNNWSWAMQLAQNITDVMKAEMNAYVWWTIIRYYGPIGDGEKALSPQDPNERYPAKGEVTKKGYVMSQFARFIRPGYYRIESTVSYALIATGLSVTAYKDPVTSKIVIVAVNSNSDPKTFVFRFKNKSFTTTLTPYYTSVYEDCQKGTDFTVTDGSFTINLEPSSITTFVSK